MVRQAIIPINIEYLMRVGWRRRKGASTPVQNRPYIVNIVDDAQIAAPISNSAAMAVASKETTATVSTDG